MTFEAASFARCIRAPTVLAMACSISLAACGEPEPLCHNKIIREALSPDGAMKATLFQRDCGPPTGSSSQVSVTAADETERSKGNTLIIDAAVVATASAWGGPDVSITWTKPRALTLGFSSRVRIIAFEPEMRGVTISYKTDD